MDGSVDPVRDIETISLELIFADADQVPQLQKISKAALSLCFRTPTGTQYMAFHSLTFLEQA